MASPGATAPDDDLHELVAAALERIEREGSRALEEFCTQHPEHSAELRRRVGTLREIGLFGAQHAEPSPQRLGDFRLVERIGSGGMGIVYHAIQESLGREVALKLIRPEMLHLPGARARFARETAIIARMHHPGIVPIYTVGGGEEVPYYAMELVPGCTLAAALAEIGSRSPESLTGSYLARAVRARTPGADAIEEPQSALYAGTWEQTALRVIRQVAEALEHAHGRGVLHRDLKPSNVMLTPGGRVMLVDFGLSQSEGVETVTRSGERAGSVPYMPPELLEHGLRAYDKRSDVYSLGVTLFQLLALRLPFEGKNEASMVVSIVQGRPRRLRAIARGASWEAETVCMVAIERDPERRYATAADFARDLGNALERKPVEARRASSWLRTRRWIESHPAGAAAIVLALLLPAAVAVLQISKSRGVAAALNVAVEKEKLASANFDRALRAVETMLQEVGDKKLDSVPGADLLRSDLLREAQALYAELGAERPDDSQLVELAADCALMQSSVLRRLGQDAEAAAIARQVLARLEQRMPDAPYKLRFLRARALALLAETVGDAAEADDWNRRARAAHDDLLSEQPGDRLLLRDAVNARFFAIVNARQRGAASPPLDLVATELLARKIVQEEPDPEALSLLARVLMARGYWPAREGCHEDALAPLQEALELRKRALAAVPSNDRLRTELAESADILSTTLLALKRTNEALAVLDLGLAESERNRSDYPDVVEHARRVVSIELNRGFTLGKLERRAEGRAAYERATSLQRDLLDRDPTDATGHRTLGTLLLNISGCQAQDGELENALASCDSARRCLERAVELAPLDPDIASWLALERNSRAWSLLDLGRIPEAAECLVQTPRLSRQRADRASQCLRTMAVCLERAQEAGDPHTLHRCRVAARTMIDLAVERGDLSQDPALARLNVLVGEP